MIRIFYCFLAMAPFAVWGWMRELAYFKTIGITIPSEATAFTYFLSGITPLILLVLLLLLFHTFRYLIGLRKSEPNPSLESSRASALLRGISHYRNLARFGFLISLLFLVTVIFGWKVPRLWNLEPAPIGVVWLYLVYVVAFLMTPLIVFEAPLERLFAAAALIVAIGFLFYADGIYEGRNAQNKTGVVRSGLFTVTRDLAGFHAQANPIANKLKAFFELPDLPKF